MSNTNYIVYRQEDEPKNKNGIWIHHKVYKDLSSPIVVQVYSLGMWRDVNDAKPGSAIRGLGVKNIISLNKEEYESLVGKDSETLYLAIDYSLEEPSVSLYLGEMLVSDSIKSVTAEVEDPEYSEYGPEVEVGQIIDGVLPMTFKHIQGPKGDTGDTGPKGEKGDQGNTGSSVDYPYELVNNVTTDDATKGLSAAQGVVLDGKINQLGQKALVPDIEILTGGYINAGDGTFSAYTADPAYYTDFIPLADDVLFFYTGQARYAVCMWAFYDEDKVFISSYGTNADADNTQVQSIPVNARYIRFSSFYTQMVIWVTSREKLYSLHLENKSSISEEANRAQNKENELQEEIDYVSAILDGFTYDKVGFYNVETGTYSDYSGAEGARAISNFLPISNDIDYIISGHSQYSAAIFVLYDADKNVLTTFPAASQNLTIENTPMRELMVIPSNAKFVRFSTFYTALAYGCRPVILEKKWLGKKWAVVGDSLTEHNRRALKNYHDYISEDTGISVLNYGVGGTGYAKDKNSNSAFFQRINSIPTDVQVITIFGSGNDIGFLPLGEITDSDTTTLCGCVNATIDAILARFPMTPFGIITTTPWFDSWTPESAPNNMSNYVDAIVEICKKKGIPCLNLFYCSNLHPEIPAIRAIEYKRDGTYVASSQGTPNAIQVTADLLSYIRNYGGLPNAQIGDWVLGTLDGVHPDEDGHKLLAPRIEAFLNSLLL